MGLKITRKTVKTFFEFINPIKRDDQKTNFMQCPVGSQEHVIWNPKVCHRTEKHVQVACGGGQLHLPQE